MTLSEQMMHTFAMASKKQSENESSNDTLLASPTMCCSPSQGLVQVFSTDNPLRQPQRVALSSSSVRDRSERPTLTRV